ncbi:hypothetical protein GW916_10370 [bacterium]|nr:hypothetical protein [bacterium]
MEELAQEAELIQLRLKSGKSFMSACKDAKAVSVKSKNERVWQERWTNLKVGVEKGHFSALESVQSFMRSLRFEIRAQKLRKKKSLLPIIQAWSVAGAAILFYLTIKIFFSEVVPMSLYLEGAILLLLGLGTYWISRLLKNFESQFWVIDWLRGQSLLLGQVKWGRSLHQCLRDFDPDQFAWPTDLKSWWKQSCLESYNYQDITPYKSSDTKIKKQDFASKYSEYWKLCLEQFNRNESFLPLMESHLEYEAQSFEDYCETLAEWLSVKLMLPLFLCFCPAFMLLCFGPLLSKITQF